MTVKSALSLQTRVVCSANAFIFYRHVARKEVNWFLTPTQPRVGGVEGGGGFV